MHPQLAAVAADLRAAQGRLHDLAAGAGEDRWLVRPGPGRWSAAECVAHLDLTTRAYLPRLERALAEGRAIAAGAPHRGPYRRTLAGWLVWRMTAAPPRLSRARTAPSFVPAGDRAVLARDVVVRAFDAGQAALLRCLHDADGLPLGRLRLASPFAERLRYDPYSAFTILAAHEHRHLAQAARAVAGE